MATFPVSFNTSQLILFADEYAKYMSVTISIPKPSRAVIVLSQLDDRYFQDLSGSSVWSFNFIVYKKGDPEEIAESSESDFGTRSVNIEMELDAGDYVVHVRSKSMMWQTLLTVLAGPPRSHLF